MDHASLKRLGETLQGLRVAYGKTREVVRGMRARDVPDKEAAYWVGIAQSFSRQAADDLQALHDAIDRLEYCLRPGGG